jgi:hypothetical protein
MATSKTELFELNRIGAVPQKNSGRGRHDKGDGILDGYWLVDVKEYESTFGLSLEVWAKTCTDAFRSGQLEPMLLLVLGKGNKVVRLVVHSYDDFQRMKDRITELESMV